MSDNGKLLRRDLPEVKQPFISDSAYDFFRNNVEVVLPAIGVFYVTIAQIWGLPFGDQVALTVNSLALLFGVIIKANKSRARNVQAVEAIIEAEQKADQYAGDLVIGTGDESMGLVTLALEKNVEEFANKDEIVLRVKNINVPR